MLIFPKRKRKKKKKVPQKAADKWLRGILGNERTLGEGSKTVLGVM